MSVDVKVLDDFEESRRVDVWAEYVGFGLKDFYTIGGLYFWVASVKSNSPVLTRDGINKVVVLAFGDSSFFLLVLFHKPMTGIRSFTFLNLFDFDPLILIPKLAELYLTDLPQFTSKNLPHQAPNNTGHFSIACWRTRHAAGFTGLRNCMAWGRRLSESLKEHDYRPFTINWIGCYFLDFATVINFNMIFWYKESFY